MNIATLASRLRQKTVPIDNPKRIEIALTFTDNQFAKLSKGLIPLQMEDKWFIFYENDALYCHRSWTGFGIYQAPLIKEMGGYSIKEFWAERNQEKYKNEDDNTDIETISFLIARGLLGIDVRQIYANQHIPAGTDSITGLKGWSNFGSLLFTHPGVDYTDKIKSVLFGVAVGNALGVPVEFKNRPTIRKNPVTDMIGYNLPPGTFSDDSSLTFCLAEALTKEFDLNTIGENFVKWYHHNYWTPRGKVFDIGITTRRAIDRLAKGKRPDLAGDVEVSSNGNGSLMRISPLLFYLLDKPIEERFEITKQVSSMTHGHIRSVMACFYYLEFARQLFAERDKFEIYKNLQTEITNHLTSLSIN